MIKQTTVIPILSLSRHFVILVLSIYLGEPVKHTSEGVWIAVDNFLKDQPQQKVVSPINSNVQSSHDSRCVPFLDNFTNQTYLPFPYRETLLITIELQCWAVVVAKLNACRQTYEKPETMETMGRVNRSISAWPTMSGDNGEPLEPFETIKATYKKLSSGLADIQKHAEAEAK